jgi:hypothetical protein
MRNALLACDREQGARRERTACQAPPPGADSSQTTGDYRSSAGLGKRRRRRSGRLKGRWTVRHDGDRALLREGGSRPPFSCHAEQETRVRGR